MLDRVALLDACEAQFSPIMSLYRDTDRALHRIFEDVTASPADASGARPQPVAMPSCGASTIPLSNRPFPMLSPNVRYFWLTGTTDMRPHYATEGSQPGHRRANDDAASNYVMMTLIEFDDPGLLLLPYHRVLGGLSTDQLSDVRSRMEEVFEARPLDLDITPQGAVDEVARRGENGHCFGVFWADAPPTIHTLRSGAGLGIVGSVGSVRSLGVAGKDICPNPGCFAG